MKPRSFSQQKGFTLIEILVSAAVFGIILLGLTQIFSSGSRTANKQILGAEANEMNQAALTRMSEIIVQAHYIYPAGQTLNLSSSDSGQGNRSFTTGASALAVLVPAGTTYCTTSGHTYCGFMFSIEERSLFGEILTGTSLSPKALIEWRVNGLNWSQDTVPAQSLASWSGASWAVLADAVDPAGSNLASSLSLAKESPIYDKADIFSTTAGAELQIDGLLAGVEPQLSLKYSSKSTDVTTKSHFIYSRAIPRATNANP